MTRLTPVVWVLSTALLWAVDSNPSKREIEAVVTEFNVAVARNDAKRTIALFTPTGTYRVGVSQPLPVAEALKKASPKRLPWDERTALGMSIQNIEFVRPDIAIVDATQSDSSPMLGSTRTWSCVFVLVKAGAGWKISSYRESGPQNGTP